nr:MAG TPA: hypothetical protein [Caudoviricetes sp.]
MGLNTGETVRQLELYSLLNRRGIKPLEIYQGRSIDKVAVEELGFKSLPSFSMSVSRDLKYMIKGAAESKKKNPRKPTYAALTDYKTETRKYNRLGDST